MDLVTILPVNLKIDKTLLTDLRDWSSSVEKNPSTHKPVNAEESHSGEKDTNNKSDLILLILFLVLLIFRY